MQPSYYEFFAGGGMARAGLGDGWECLFANDIDVKKAAAYAVNWQAKDLRVGDIARLQTTDLPGYATLAWASFPCQDLSLAGAGAGLSGERSGTFWPFWRLMRALGEEGRSPAMIVLENVCGALSSHDGKDFCAIADALTEGGYRFGAVVADAVHFLPQSRPRLFIVAVREWAAIPAGLLMESPHPLWHPANLQGAHSKLSEAARERWLWWRLPEPPKRQTVFADLLEDDPAGVAWHSPKETRRLLSLMSAVNLEKVQAAKKLKRRMAGAIYRRTRIEAGLRVQRAEIRFDDVAGCLRTPAGGSSRQVILIVEGERLRSRLLSPREAARLMGLPDSYILPANYNEAYHLMGDGVAVPVVRFLSESILKPLLEEQGLTAREAA